MSANNTAMRGQMPTNAYANSQSESYSFFGVTSGEIFKALRQRTHVILFFGVALISGLLWIAFLARPNVNTLFTANPTHYFYTSLTISYALLRIFSGLFFITLTARIIGLDFQQGTIRIILARGVNKVVLFWAKMLAIFALAIGALAIFIALDTVWGMVMTSLQTHSTVLFSSLNADFWGAIVYYWLSLVINTVATIAITAFFTVLGRSLTFGQSLGLGFFPADNFIVILLPLISQLFNNTTLLNISAYFLGPNLNYLPKELAPTLTFTSTTFPASPATAGISPLIHVDLTNTLTVIVIYTAVSLIAATYLTYRRDVLE